MASQLVGVKYIGGKTKKVDNVANTGAEWVPGQVINFNIEIANKLLVHKSVWEIVDVDPNGDTYIGSKKAAGAVVDPVPFVNLHEMDINALAAFAKVEFNQAVDISLPIESARNLVHGFMSNRTMDDLATLNKPSDKHSIGIEVNEAEYQAYIAGELVLKLVPAGYTGQNVPELTNEPIPAQEPSTENTEPPAVEALAATIESSEPTGETSGNQSAADETAKVDTISDLKADLDLLDAKQLREMCKQSGIPYSNTMPAEKLREKILAAASATKAE